MDFLLERDAEIIPLEVKSGKDYDRHVALNNVMNNVDYGIRKAIVLCNDNLKTRGGGCDLCAYLYAYVHREVEGRRSKDFQA